MYPWFLYLFVFRFIFQTVQLSLRQRVSPMSKNKNKEKKKSIRNVKGSPKQLPPPPEEHAYELKMEKRLKRMLEGKKKERREK
jgi:hypothetical protein